ncbi:MAG TPA: O-antigen ligase family protein [Thermoanaerobaculia bacterium]|nr:O-antigen ligase family protein [Thermoanaerobaculia bacterium]
MRRRTAPLPQRSTPKRPEQVLWYATAASVVAVQVAFSTRTPEAFRLPKAALFQASVLLLTGAAAVALLLSPSLRERLALRAPSAIAAGAAIVIWTGVTALSAVNRTVGVFAFFSAVLYFVFFLLVLHLAPHSTSALAVLVFPAGLNAGVAVLQRTSLWNPFSIQTLDRRLTVTGLIGNPNDVADTLLLPLLAAIAAGLVWRQARLRWWAGAAIVLAGIVSTGSVAAVAAAAFGIAAIAIAAHPRRQVVIACALIMTLGTAAAAFRLWQRAGSPSVSRRSIVELSSYRAPAYLAAFEMFRDRPLTGVGPRNFAVRYMQYRLAVDEKFPQWVRTENVNFGEVHNDHLQVLAETGLPGYALFLIALVSIARISVRKEEGNPDEYGRFARLFALPAIIAFGIVSFFHFPTQLAAPMTVTLHAAGLALSWSRT